MHWPLAVPKLQGSKLVFLWPRRRKILELKGNIISDPPPNICSTCGARLKNLIRGSGSVNLYVSVEGLSDFMLVLYFLGHYALPFWEHYA